MAVSIETYTIDLNLDTSAVSKGLKETQGRIRKSVESIQKRLTNIRLPALAIAGGGVAIFKGLTDSASDLEESINAVNVSFGEGADIIKDFGKNSATEVGLAASSFNELATGLGPLLSQAGFSAEESAKQTIELTKRAADMASVYNIDVGEALSALNQGLRGEAEAMRRFGVDVTSASLDAFALSQGLDRTTKDMTQQEKSALRLQLMMAKTSKVEGDFANTSDSAANQARIQAAIFEDMRGKLGTKLLPILNKLLSISGSILKAFNGLSDSTQGFIAKALIGTTVIAGVTAALGFVIGPISSVIGLFGKLIGLLKAFRISSIAAFLTNPVTLIIAGIAAAVFLLWDAFNGGEKVLKPIWEWFSNKFPNAAEVIKNAFQTAVNAVSRMFDKIANIWEKLKGIVSSAREFITGADRTRAETIARASQASGAARTNVVRSGPGSDAPPVQNFNVETVNVNSEPRNSQQLETDIRREAKNKTRSVVPAGAG